MNYLKEALDLTEKLLGTTVVKVSKVDEALKFLEKDFVFEDTKKETLSKLLKKSLKVKEADSKIEISQADEMILKGLLLGLKIKIETDDLNEIHATLKKFELKESKDSLKSILVVAKKNLEEKGEAVTAESLSKATKESVETCSKYLKKLESVYKARDNNPKLNNK